MHVGWLFGISSINSINPQCINILSPSAPNPPLRKCLSTPNTLTFTTCRRDWSIREDQLNTNLVGKKTLYHYGNLVGMICLLHQPKQYARKMIKSKSHEKKHAFPWSLFLSPKYKWHLNDKTCVFFCKVQLPFCLILTLSFLPTGMISYWQHCTQKERKWWIETRFFDDSNFNHLTLAVLHFPVSFEIEVYHKPDYIIFHQPRFPLK